MRSAVRRRFRPCRNHYGVSIDLAPAYRKVCELLPDFPGLRRIIVFSHKGGGLIQKYVELGRIALALEFREAFLELEPDTIPVEFLPTVAQVCASDRCSTDH